tara:strand:+ start:2729 stop:3439 length:711 start_codon:yes stop_codon:yes gene_type:complete
MDYKCKFCSKIYKRKIPFDKHVIICEINHKTITTFDTRCQESEDIYDNEKLSNLVLILFKKVDDLEKKIQKISIIQKKKINIENWLNENKLYTPSITFNDWVSNIEINDVSIYNLIQNDFIIGLIQILEHYIYLSDIPLKAFDKKIDDLYSYDGEKWTLMTRDQFNNFIVKISRKILNTGMIIIIDTPNLNKDFEINIKKINGGNFKDDRIHTLIKKDIYSKIKIDIKNIIEYEFN